MNDALFITGTDTGAGKTVITGLLGRFLLEKGVNAVTQKWVQTGCTGFSEDIAVHLKLMNMDRSFIEGHINDVAPYIFEFPASPHLAAGLEKKHIDISRIESSFIRLKERFEFVAVEGSGGLMVPLNETTTLIDIINDLDLKVLIVAENRLGGINQTILTVESLQRRNIRVVGIIFNCSEKGENNLILEDNPRIVKKLTGVNILGVLGHDEDIDRLYETFRPIGEKILDSLKLCRRSRRRRRT